MRGVPPNSLDMSPLQIMKNDVFNDLITILGLKFGEDFNINDLKFDKIVISTDADVDGDKIAALLLLLFSHWPELFKQGIVCRSITPIIIAKKGKDIKKYYSIEEFDKESKKLKGYMVKYVKGLSGLDAAETKETMRNPIFMHFKEDDLTNSMFKKWFGKNSDERKNMMCENV
jgi:DNA gyrase/topoisomerase IV subunit B